MFEKLFAFVTSTPSLARLFGRIEIDKLAKFCSDKFQKDVYITSQLKRSRPEKIIHKMQTSADWAKYFNQLAANNNVLSVEISNASSPDWIIIYQNYPKNRNLFIFQSSKFESDAEMKKSILTNKFENAANKFITTTNFENLRLYQIYKVLFSSINIASLLIVALMFVLLFLPSNFAGLWSAWLLRGFLIYGTVALLSSITGFWLNKYPNLIWEITNTGEGIDRNNQLITTNIQYIQIFTPVILVLIFMLYYIIFLP
jgi:hypothetical protein